MSANPDVLVTVVMAVYNVQDYIKESINSVLNQSYRNFEFIIIDDYSSDATIDEIMSFNDHRIQLLRNLKNLGLAASLNKGIEIAKGKYIIRMDGDDICLPDRFLIQVYFMEQNPDVSICGSYIYRIGDSGVLKKIAKYPLSNLSTKWSSLFYSPVAHPATILRLDDFRNYSLKYDSNYTKAQDYELWTRCLMKGLKIRNISRPLIYYRELNGSLVKDKDQKCYFTRLIQEKYWENLGIDLSDQEKQILHKIGTYEICSIDDIKSFIEQISLKLEVCYSSDKKEWSRVLIGVGMHYVLSSRLGFLMSLDAFFSLPIDLLSLKLKLFPRFFVKLFLNSMQRSQS